MRDIRPRKRFQFNLRSVFVVFVFIGPAIWLATHPGYVLVSLLFAPLLGIAILFEWKGYSEIAILIGVPTAAIWLMTVLWS